MSKYRSFDEVQEKYYRDHPEEIDEFLSIAFEDYASDKDTGALLVQLRMIARVKGVSTIAEAASMSRKGLQKALSICSAVYSLSFRTSITDEFSALNSCSNSVAEIR